ncbi:MAG: hypothetical protein AAFO77_15205, partial [Pseudomonadota bacterium]
MEQTYDFELGTREIYGGHYPFGLDDHDAFQHVWFPGQTGTGKSTILLSAFSQAVANGHGCTFVDLNGDAALQASDTVPLARRNDVVVIDFADTENVLSLNPLFDVPFDRRAILADDFTLACQEIWPDGWGSRMDWILFNFYAALLDAPARLRPTLHSIELMLSNDAYRNDVIKHVQQPKVREFFRNEFEKYTANSRSDYLMSVQAIQNKIGKFTSNPLVANAFKS